MEQRLPTRTGPVSIFPPLLSVFGEIEPLSVLPGDGLSFSEDDNTVFVEAALPGVDPKDIEVTYDDGALRISGGRKEEEKGKRYYRKATSSFNYRLIMPEAVERKVSPAATYKNGVVSLTFKKLKAREPKRIPVKAVM